MPGSCRVARRLIFLSVFPSYFNLLISSGNYTKKEGTDMTSLQKRFVRACVRQARLNDVVGQATSAYTLTLIDYVHNRFGRCVRRHYWIFSLLNLQACLPAIELPVELGCKLCAKQANAVKKTFVRHMRTVQQAEPIGIGRILQRRRDLGFEPDTFRTPSCLLRRILRGKVQPEGDLVLAVYV